MFFQRRLERQVAREVTSHKQRQKVTPGAGGCGEGMRGQSCVFKGKGAFVTQAPRVLWVGCRSCSFPPSPHALSGSFTRVFMALQTLFIFIFIPKTLD